jgi:TetR/AcrR family transcriptional regulator, transcriptional repressor of bet genes
VPGVKAPEQERRAQILEAAVAVATAERLDGLTVRKVANEAQVSPGLVFFHFGSKDRLLLDLLDRVLEEIIGRRPPEDATGAPSARDALLRYARRELERLPSERDFVELFFDFWVVGTRNPAVRRRVADAMAAYRASFEPLAGGIIAEDATRFDGVPPGDVARIIVAFVQGTAFQAVLEPEPFDVDALMAALEALVPPPGR